MWQCRQRFRRSRRSRANGAETVLVRSGTSHISVISHVRASIGRGDQIALRVAPGSVHLFDRKSVRGFPTLRECSWNTESARGRARQMKTRYSFELWDLCGTSYAPFPLDAPRVIGKTKCS